MKHMGRVFDDEAVSETLGYILIFMIVLTCIAFILYAGNGVLASAKAQNNFEGMEQGFSVLNSDLKQVALEGTPLKTTRIHMEGGSISAKADTNHISIKFQGVDKYQDDTGYIKFMLDSDSSIVSLENGGVWEKPGGSGGNLVVLKPRIYRITDPDTGVQTLVVNLIKLDATPPSSIGGSTTIDVTLKDEGTNVYTYEEPSGSSVDIKFYTDYPDAWARFFTDIGATGATVNSDHIMVTFPAISKVIISVHQVGVAIS